VFGFKLINILMPSQEVKKGQGWNEPPIGYISKELGVLILRVEHNYICL